MGQGPGKQDLELTPLPAIQKRILVVRDRHVMLDEDLAELYGVETHGVHNIAPSADASRREANDLARRSRTASLQRARPTSIASA